MSQQFITIILALFLCSGSISAGTIQPYSPQQETQERLNINTASAEQLMQLPGIGPGYAARIIAHRQKHGAFKRPQDIVIVRGFSAKRYRQLAHLIRI